MEEAARLLAITEAAAAALARGQGTYSDDELAMAASDLNQCLIKGNLAELVIEGKVAMLVREGEVQYTAADES